MKTELYSEVIEEEHDNTFDGVIQNDKKNNMASYNQYDFILTKVNDRTKGFRSNM